MFFVICILPLAYASFAMEARVVLSIASVAFSSGSACSVQSLRMRAPENTHGYLPSTESHDTTDPRIALQSFLLAWMPGVKLQVGAAYNRNPARSELRHAIASPSIENSSSSGEQLFGNRWAKRHRVIGSVKKGVFVAAAGGPSLRTSKVIAKEPSEVVKLEQSLQDTKTRMAKLKQSLQEMRTMVTVAGLSKQEAEAKAQEAATRAENLKSEVVKLEPLLQEAKAIMVTLEQLLQDAKAKATEANTLLQEAESTAAEEATRAHNLQIEVADLEQLLREAKTKAAKFEQSLKDAKTNATAAERSKKEAKSKARKEARKEAKRAVSSQSEPPINQPINEPSNQPTDQWFRAKPLQEILQETTDIVSSGDQYETVLFMPGELGFFTMSTRTILQKSGVKPGWEIVAVNDEPCQQIGSGPWERAIRANSPFYATFAIGLPTNQPTNKQSTWQAANNQRTNEPANQTTNQSMNQPIKQSTNQRQQNWKEILQETGQPTTDEPMFNQPTKQPTNDEPTEEPVNQPIVQPTNQPTEQRQQFSRWYTEKPLQEILQVNQLPTNQATSNKPTWQRASNQPAKEPANQPSDQLSYQPINQPMTQVTNQRQQNSRRLPLHKILQEKQNSKWFNAKQSQDILQETTEFVSSGDRDQYKTILFTPEAVSFSAMNTRMILQESGVKPGWRIVAVNDEPCKRISIDPNAPWERAIRANRPFYATFVTGEQYEEY